jgi:hypothetical protein
MQGKALHLQAQFNKQGNCAEHNNFDGIPNSCLITSEKKRTRLPQSFSRLAPCFISIRSYGGKERKMTL